MGKNLLKHLIKVCGLGILVFVSGCASETGQTGTYQDGNRVQTVPFPPGMFQETWCQDGTFFVSAYDNRYQCTNRGGVRESQKTFSRDPSSSDIHNQSFNEGYTVMCNDGSWSSAGGKQGACSHHGGVDD